MPRNLSAWMDLTVHLVVMLALISVLYFYNEYIAAGAAVLWLCLASFARERCADRSRRFEIYFKNVLRNLGLFLFKVFLYHNQLHNLYCKVLLL